MVSEHDSADAAVDAAADRLYAASPDEFMSLRTELAKAAKADGDAAAAKAIGALRKPTVGASVVNRFVLADSSIVERLVGLGDRLRRAQQELDAAELRELTTERRATVAEITRDAFAHADRGDPTTALRDEVSATFDAAVADPDVAQRLGRLVRGESFSGFGVAPGPGLTLVQGGRSAERASTPRRARSDSRSGGQSDEAPAAKSGRKSAAKSDRKSGAKSADEVTPEPPATPPVSPRLTRRLERARTEFETADEEFTSAESAQQREGDRVKSLSDELRELQQELDDAKRALDRARREVRATRTRRREARSALDRAERAVERGTDG